MLKALGTTISLQKPQLMLYAVLLVQLYENENTFTVRNIYTQKAQAVDLCNQF